MQGAETVKWRRCHPEDLSTFWRAHPFSDTSLLRHVPKTLPEASPLELPFFFKSNLSQLEQWTNNLDQDLSLQMALIFFFNWDKNSYNTKFSMKGNNSETFRTCAMLRNHHLHLAASHFHHPKRRPQPLWIALLWTFMNIQVISESLFSALWGINLGIELLNILI